MSAREAILARIRRSLGVSGADLERQAHVRERLASSPRGVIPIRSQVPEHERIALFVRMAQDAHAVVRQVQPGEIPQIVGDFLDSQDVPRSVRMGSDPRLAAIPWGPLLEVHAGTPSPDDLASVSHAEAGIAETGTVVILSGPENPTLLNFLPLIHIVVVKAADVVGDAETAMAEVRRHLAGGPAPRAITFITGPSRSGDIDQTMYLGAHGPRGLLVLVVAR